MFDLPSHSHGQFAIGENDKNEIDDCQIFFIVFIRK